MVWKMPHIWLLWQIICGRVNPKWKQTINEWTKKIWKFNTVSALETFSQKLFVVRCVLVDMVLRFKLNASFFYFVLFCNSRIYFVPFIGRVSSCFVWAEWERVNWPHVSRTSSVMCQTVSASSQFQQNDKTWKQEWEREREKERVTIK